MPPTKRKAPEESPTTTSSSAKRIFARIMITPEILLNSSNCKAQVLSVSDQHAIVLLETTPATSHNNNEDDEEAVVPPPTVKSLLKLTVQTFHKDFLERSEYNAVGVVESNSNTTTTTTTVTTPKPDELSQRILSFLSNYSFRRTSESGAEYSYYDATPKTAAIALGSITNAWNVLTGFGRTLLHLATGGVSTLSSSSTPQVFTAFQAELISPASDRQIQRVLPSPAFHMVYETPEIYHAVVKPMVQSFVQDGSLNWVLNVVQGKKEKERLLLDTDSYILNIDTKWKSHPDPLTVPREEWKGHKAAEDLYCLAIVKDSALTSLRDLTVEHLPLLRSILTECPRVIEETYGVSFHQLRIFVHYQPQFYHFHVHFTRLENEFGCQAERAHLLSDIVQNLEMDGEYYAKRTSAYKLRVTDKLYRLIDEANKSSGIEEETLAN